MAALVTFVDVIDDLHCCACLRKSSHNGKHEGKSIQLRFVRMNSFVPRPLSTFFVESSGKSWTQLGRWRSASQIAMFPTYGTKRDLAIVWLRRELRLHDNIALVEAAKHYRRILPLFIFERGSTTHNKQNNIEDRTFMLSEDLLYEDLSQEPYLIGMCLRDLKKQLQQSGSDLLVILSHDPVESLLELIRSTGAQGLYFYHSIFTKERRQELELKRRLESNLNVNVCTFWTNTLHSFDKLISKDTPSLEDCDQFGKYIHEWEIPNDIPSPEYLKPFPYERLEDGKYALDDDILSILKKECEGKEPDLMVSEREALNLLTKFVSSQTCGWIQQYPNESKIDTKYGRMNPFLSLGCISMRTIYRRVLENIPHSLRRYCVEMDLLFREFLMFRYFQTA